MPSPEIATALGKVTGVEGKVTIDATNAIGGRPEGFESLAHQVKSIAGGPTAKALNTVFARQYDEIAGADPKPSCLWCIGDLRYAVNLEDFLLNIVFPIAQDRQAPFFYRIG